MAHIHKATLTPSKLELLTPWLRSRAWADGSGGVQTIGAYRFDDPQGEVGIETFLLRTTTGAVLHVPATYRSEPLRGADEHLIGTTEHSALGTRWVYDGCGDPVWAAVLTQVVLTGGTQASEMVDDGNGGLIERPPTATVVGSGEAGAEVPPVAGAQPHDEAGYTVVTTGGPVLVVAREVGRELTGVTHTLTVRWADAEPVIVAGIRQ
ncbi:hypothetical protein LWF15_04680 [Kineosporia rhizophila]|uniref:CG0192-related protein n=1 Tax=Kineosporia TaxID=49184 RepID=UPI001E2845E5|nr:MULTISPECIES: hypothetical protein [Kineosporia]MCE0534796.1 hypothetical protein [Kineosporia rhizophila]GLY19277.1 hypothetical protein Kisp01_62910 [Kineosporia sp. NBRC 101677]